MGTVFERKTSETEIFCEWDAEVDRSEINIPCGFLCHMLDLFCFHAGIKVIIRGKGDLQVDYHHLVEDLGIVLGKAFYAKIYQNPNSRYGWSVLPMDGSLVLSSVDISGRSSLSWKINFPAQKCGDFDLELVEEFWKAFSRESRTTVHFVQLSCDNSHHLCEALFKSAGRSFALAMKPSEEIRSTKGILL